MGKRKRIVNSSLRKRLKNKINALTTEKMYKYKFKVFAFLVMGIILAIVSILLVIDKDYKFAIKIFAVGIIFIIVSIYERKWIKKTIEGILAVPKVNSKTLKTNTPNA